MITIKRAADLKVGDVWSIGKHRYKILSISTHPRGKFDADQLVYELELEHHKTGDINKFYYPEWLDFRIYTPSHASNESCYDSDCECIYDMVEQ